MFGLTPFERKSFDLFDAFHDFEKDFFTGNLPMNSCKTDIRDEGDKFVMEAELPGFEKSDTSIPKAESISPSNARFPTWNAPVRVARP